MLSTGYRWEEEDINHGMSCCTLTHSDCACSALMCILGVHVEQELGMSSSCDCPLCRSLQTTTADFRNHMQQS